MADKKKPAKTVDEKPNIASKVSKKAQTVRQRAADGPKEKPKRIRREVKKVAVPLKKARIIGSKEYHLPLPDSKAGKILKKRVRILPEFFVNAYREVKLVTWPDRKNTVRLTLAVFVFSVIFAAFVGGLDYVLNIIFKKLFVN